MAVLAILGTFLCMLGLVGATICTLYSCHRRMWFAAFLSIIVGLICLSLFLGAMHAVDQQHAEIAEIERGDHDN